MWHVEIAATDIEGQTSECQLGFSQIHVSAIFVINKELPHQACDHGHPTAEIVDTYATMKSCTVTDIDEQSSTLTTAVVSALQCSLRDGVQITTTADDWVH